MRMMVAVTMGAALLAAGCGQEPAGGATSQAGKATIRYRCDLQPTQGNTAKGWVMFESMGDHVHVTAEVSGLTPGKHGFHIHEKGDCSSPDGKSAGGHFNPEGKPHGGPDASERHHGDLGNLEAGADGLARYERMDFTIRLEGPNSILGRAIIVHAGEDDLTSQPTGAAGARVACGVIAEDR